MKKKYQEKWENAYLTVKSATVMYLQTKVNEQIKILIVSDKETEIALSTMVRIFHIEIDIL